MSASSIVGNVLILCSMEVPSSWWRKGHVQRQTGQQVQCGWRKLGWSRQCPARSQTMMSLNPQSQIRNSTVHKNKHVLFVAYFIFSYWGWQQTCYTVKKDSELLNFPPPGPECWNHRHMPQCQAYLCSFKLLLYHEVESCRPCGSQTEWAHFP